jgi:hypothetical protein
MVPLRFNDAKSFSEGLAAVEFSNGKNQYGFIDHDGNTVIKPQYGDAEYFVNGLVPVAVNFKYGYINRQNTMIIPPQFERGYSFSDGIACVITKENKYGFIDISGKFVIDPKFDLSFGFHNGLASVSIGKMEYDEKTSFPFFSGKTGYIDKKGVFIWEPSE